MTQCVRYARIRLTHLELRNLPVVVNHKTQICHFLAKLASLNKLRGNDENHT
ncbi:MAG: hypothetical protein FD147_1102 [Chloroflexi bacterium]|nr:MAG: hypothetical protein FD147_1102 [Chloroflexota bacterium]